MSESLSAASNGANESPQEEALLGHVLGKVSAVEPSRTGDGVKVSFVNARGETKVAYFAATGSIPKVDEELRFSAWRQPAGNVQFRRETTTEADLDGLLV